MNREISPGSIYPISGDVTSSTGNRAVIVTGLRGQAISDVALVGGETMIFDPNVFQWTPRVIGAVQINGVSVSDDSSISVNVPKIALINGV